MQSVELVPVLKKILALISSNLSGKCKLEMGCRVFVSAPNPGNLAPTT